MIPAYVRAFKEALLSTPAQDFTIRAFDSTIRASPGVQSATWLRYRDEDFQLLKRRHEYTFKIHDSPDVEVLGQFYKTDLGDWHLLAYCKNGMLLSLDITRAQHGSSVIPLRKRLKSFTRNLTKVERSESMDALVKVLRGVGLRVSEDRIVDLGDFDTVRGVFLRTTARQFMQDFMTAALIKGHFMGNKDIRLPGLDPAPEPTLDRVEASLEQINEEIEDEDGFDPTNQEDARDRTLASIACRRGQRAFRRALLAAYGRRCAISGCNFEGALEAAHILAYRGEHTNHVQNGLLLRADLHTLFDLKYIAVDSGTMTVRLSPVLQGTTYEDLDGQEVSLPEDPRLHPSTQALDDHRREAGL